jgi:type I restriction enzyme, R subunit
MQETFGGYVSIYDIEDAKEDKATVPIYYESRLAKLDINREAVVAYRLCRAKGRAQS